MVVPSTSGRVLIDGKPWSSKASWHAYVRVDDPDDFRARVWDQALVKSFSVNALLTDQSLGFMRHAYSKNDPTVRVTVRGTPWAIWAPTTCASERLVYDGAPTVVDHTGGGLTVAPANARVLRDGGRLVTSDFVDLTEPQQRKPPSTRSATTPSPARTANASPSPA